MKKTISLVASLFFSDPLLASPERTVSQIQFEVNSYLFNYVTTSPRPFIIQVNSCQSIIENYYDELERCHSSVHCDEPPPFPATRQALIVALDKSRYKDSDGGIGIGNYYVAREAIGECIFEPRVGPTLYPTERTEKGWTPVEIVTDQTRMDEDFNIILPQKVTAVTASLSSKASNTGIWMCGPDIESGISDFPVSGFLSSSTPVIEGGNKVIKSMQYRIGKEFIDRPFNLWEEGSRVNYSAYVLQAFVGEIHPETPMMAGDCNSSCVDPAWEVYALSHVSSNKTMQLTKGASTPNSWKISKYTNFTENKEFFLPSKILFTQEAQKEAGDLYSFLPGGSYFGYKKSIIYVR